MGKRYAVAVLLPMDAVDHVPAPRRQASLPGVDALTELIDAVEEKNGDLIERDVVLARTFGVKHQLVALRVDLAQPPPRAAPRDLVARVGTPPTIATFICAS